MPEEKHPQLKKIGDKIKNIQKQPDLPGATPVDLTKGGKIPVLTEEKKQAWADLMSDKPTPMKCVPMYDEPISNEVNMDIQIFNYEGKEITFQTGDDVMINATQMAKPFGKQVSDWTKLDSTKEFLQVLDNQQTEDLPNAGNQLVRVVRGGLNPGTWMHEDVALEFARWLNPVFAIWCNARIKELLTKGFTGKTDGHTEYIEDEIGPVNYFTTV